MLAALFFVFLFGIVFGSFLNVVIYRMTHGSSPFKGRSICPKCKRKISWQHNIPLLSFFLLRGRCANCGKKISWQYPVVEFITGALFVWWFLIGRSFFHLSGGYLEILQPAFWLVVGMALLVVFFADLWFGVIPDAVNIFLLVLALAYRVVLVLLDQMQNADLSRSFLSGLMLFGFFYFLYWVTKKKGFGLGDVKLAPAMGLLLGWPRTLVAVLAAFFTGAIIGLFLLATGKKKLGQTVPFGPFLILGTVVALVWGEALWRWYMRLLGIV